MNNEQCTGGTVKANGRVAFSVGPRPTCKEQPTKNNPRADVPCPRRALPYAECCKAVGLGRIVRAFPIFNYPFSIKLRCSLFIVYCSLFIGINIFA